MPSWFNRRQLRLLDGNGTSDLFSVISKLYDRKTHKFLFARSGKFWNVVRKAHAAGFSGEGQIIGIFDSGIDLTDEFLNQAIIESVDFTKSRHPIFGDGQDGHGHGTVVALLMRAIAPGAKLVNIKVIDNDGFGADANLLRALKWAHKGKITVANLSVGRPSTSPLSWALSSNSRLSMVFRPTILQTIVQSGADAGRYAKRMNTHWLRRCSLCRQIDRFNDEGVPMCVSIGNFTDHASCPARAAGAVSVGGGSITQAAPSNHILWQQQSADVPLFDQTIGADLAVVAGFDVVPGSSMLAPMATGLFALGMTMNEWRGDTNNNFQRVVTLADWANSLMATGSSMAAGKFYLKALSASPHQSEHKGTRLRHECWLCSMFLGECIANLGLAYLANGAIDQARQTLEEAMKLTPWEAANYLNMGAVLRTKKLYEESVACYEDALRLEPNNARAYEGLGTTYELAGNKPKAKANYEKALDLDSTSQFARRFFSASGRDS
jgi:hypothetical protein